jgi:bifunctional non-homologous end joining protein LigD
MATLKEYHKKRSFDRTPEPEGSVHASEDRVFVVQKHAATRLHYDLRLELDGVLKSWAVPKGPSLNPDDKRLAVQVEDHPFEYRTFEGSIPKGQYGGGEVIVWDEGTYAPEGNLSARDQLAKGELKFQLHGEKLRGSFVLVKLRKPGTKNEWLLIKHRDSFAHPEWNAEEHSESVVTGRTLEDIAAGREASSQPFTRDPSAITGAVEASMPQMPKGVSVTLAQLKERPFSDPEWLFEIKWDGVRAVAQIQDGKVTLWARSGRDVTREYPEFRDLAKHFRVANAIVDGEIVSLDADGRSDFQKLQNRLGAQNPSQTLVQSVPVNYYFFDLLYADGFDLRKSPLLERKELLKRVLIADEKLHYSDHVLEKGAELFEAAREKGLEGIIGKRFDSSYAGARTSSWVKIKIVKEADVVVAGYTAGRGSRKYFGALVMGLYEKRELKFIGSVGTGLDEELQKSIFDRLQELRVSRSAFRQVPVLREEVQWVKPELVARVKYGNWTEDAHLRVPVFLSLRNDRTAEESTFAAARPVQVEEQPAKPKKAAKVPVATRASTSQGGQQELSGGTSESLDLESDGQRVHLTHLNKIYFPQVGLKKRDLLAYYDRMAEYIVPFLKDRPLVMRRYPDGVDGKVFFQKEAPSFIPDWIEKATIYSDERGGEMQYLMASNRAALLYLTNLGCIDHNPWSSRAKTQDHPDYVFFDLDPTPETPFSTVLQVARGIYGLLQSIRLACFLKTSGASGFHIFVPLEPRYTYEQTRTFAEVVGRLVATEHPKLITFERTVKNRPQGRVLIDALQNARGKPLACVYSVRAFPKAGVSCPLSPEELMKSVSPEKWNLKNVPERVRDIGDLWKDFWKKRQTLDRALELLDAKMPKREAERS